jgi:hypothetical protein
MQPLNRNPDRSVAIEHFENLETRTAKCHWLTHLGITITGLGQIDD